MSSNGQPVSGEERVLGLDLLRAVAAVWVVVIHADVIVRKALPGFPNFVILDPVDLFFTLSGFLIGRIILREIVDAPPGGSARALGRFWVRRWLRTLPAYYATVIVAYLLSVSCPRLRVAFDWRFFVFLQNTWTAHPPFVGNAWSLSVEEYFYLLFPLTTVLLFAILRNRRRLAYLLASLLLILGATAVRCHLAYKFAGATNISDFAEWCRKLMPARLDAIAYGTLGALVAVARPALWRSLALPGALTALTFFLLRNKIPYSPRALWIAHPSVMPLITLLALPLLTRLREAPRWFAAPVRHISKVSYSTYLVHYPLALTPIIVVVQPSGESQVLVWYVGYFIMALLLTYALHYGVEGPGLAWRKRISARWQRRGHRQQVGVESEPQRS